jgi:hypothetical protein
MGPWGPERGSVLLMAACVLRHGGFAMEVSVERFK